jgi:hypothetical protein
MRETNGIQKSKVDTPLASICVPYAFNLLPTLIYFDVVLNVFRVAFRLFANVLIEPTLV